MIKREFSQAQNDIRALEKDKQVSKAAVEDKKKQILSQEESMHEMKTKLEVMEIRQQLSQGPATVDSTPLLPVTPMSMFGIGGPLALPMSMNNVAQNTVQNAKLKNLAAIKQMEELLQELTVEQDSSEVFSPNLSIGATSQLSLALQKSDFGSKHEVQNLLKEKKYFELLQKSLKALAELQKAEMNRSRFSDLMSSMVMPDSPKRGLGDSLVLDRTLYPTVRETSTSMLELKLQNAESMQLRDADNGSTLSREDFDFNDEYVIRFSEEYESEDPTEGEVLTFYKTRKERIADRSGGPLPEMPQKEKVAPLKPPLMLTKSDIRKNVQPSKPIVQPLESIMNLNENLEAVTEQENEDKSTPRTNFSGKTPPIINDEAAQLAQARETATETPLQEYHPKQSNPQLQLNDTESLDFAPVGKVKESSIKKEQIIPKFMDIELQNSKEKSNSKSARGQKSPSDLMLEQNDVLSEKNVQIVHEEQKIELVTPEQKQKQDSVKVTPKKDEPVSQDFQPTQSQDAGPSTQQVTPEKKQIQDPVKETPREQQQEQKVIQTTVSPDFRPSSEPVATENAFSPTNKRQQKPSKEQEYANFLDDGDAMPTPQFKVEPIKKSDYLTVNRQTASLPKQRIDPDKSISEISNYSWRQTSIVSFKGKKRLLHVESSSDEDAKSVKEINTSFNPIKDFYESSPAPPKSVKARSGSNMRQKSASKAQSKDIQTIVEAIDEISAIGKSPRSDHGSLEKPSPNNEALNVDLSPVIDKANHSMMINDVISDFADRPISPLGPVRNSKRFVSRDLNNTPFSEMSSGKLSRNTPRTAKGKFNKLQALQTPILVKKQQEKEKEERRKLSQSMVMPSKSNNALLRFKPKIPARNTASRQLLNASFSSNRLDKSTEVLNMSMQLKPGKSLSQTQRPKKNKKESGKPSAFKDQH